MVDIKKLILYETTPETVEAVRKTFNLEKPGAMEDAVNILDEWIKQQNHFLKKDFDRGYLEKIIIRTKGSVEKAKEAIDLMCTCRTELPQYFKTLKLKDLELLKDFKPILMPKLTKDNLKVIILRNNVQHFDHDVMINGFAVLLHFLEHGFLTDYAAGTIVILDYQGVNFADYLKNMDFSYALHFAKVFLHGFDLRVQAVHFVSKSKLMKTFMGLINQLLSSKLFSRTFVHEDIGALTEHVEKECLPIEYGGTGPSFYKVFDQYVEALSSEDFIKFMDDMNNAKVDESLRPAGSKRDDFFGVEGTFRSLQVD